jgi:NAD(P)-dependent dehydrogenase (short-subunit alcohol dehydrogenase family)
VPEVALVCGGGGALGSALVRSLLDRGDRVVVAELHPDPSPPPDGRCTPSMTSAEGWRDVGRLAEAATSALGRERGRWLPAGTVAESEVVRDRGRLNLGTAWWSCREQHGGFRGGGSSTSRPLREVRGAGPAYAVAKAGVVRLTEILAVELRAAHPRQRDPAVDRHAGEPGLASADSRGRPCGPAESPRSAPSRTASLRRPWPV